jgi:ArsR family transcriptional regulator
VAAEDPDDDPERDPDGDGPDRAVEASAALLSTVADPYRLALLQALTLGTVCVCELQTQIPIASNLMSYHLRVLREAGLVVGTRRGRWVDYAIAPGALDRLHAALPALAASAPPVTSAIA